MVILALFIYLISLQPFEEIEIISNFGVYRPAEAYIMLRQRVFFYQNFRASVPKFRHFEISHDRVHIFFHQNFRASIPKFRHFEISHTRLHIFLHRVIASQEANDGVVPLTCFSSMYQQSLTYPMEWTLMSLYSNLFFILVTTTKSIG